MGTEHEQLAASDPVIAGLLEAVGETSIAERRARRPDVDAYGMLLRSVVGQQLSVKAAATIYGRVLDLFGGVTPAPQALLDVDPQRLREAGLSGRKVEYVRDLAEHVLSGRARARPARPALRRGGGRRDHGGARVRRLERPDVPDLLPRAPRRAPCRRPRDPQGRPARLRPRRDAEGGRADAGSRSRGARTGRSPRSSSGRASTTSRCSRPGEAEAKSSISPALLSGRTA